MHREEEPLPRGRHVRWWRSPPLRHPVIVAAFEGWNDAGDAATTATRHLRDRFAAQPFAEIDPEEFFDFTSTRPTVEITEGFHRRIRWPFTELCASDAGLHSEVITVVGIEPHLRWRTFCDQIITVARATDARLVVTLGALLTEVAHTRPTEVFGTAYDQRLTREIGLSPSRYEGPTGIVGVLHAACTEAGIPSASLWAGVPSYVPGATSPKAALALLRRLGDLLNTSIPTRDLEIAAASYERQVSRLVAEDDETAAYVAHLEARHDRGDDEDDDEDDLDWDLGLADLEDDGNLGAGHDGPEAADAGAGDTASPDGLGHADPGSLVEEVEQYLRNQPE